MQFTQAQAVGFLVVANVPTMEVMVVVDVLAVISEELRGEEGFAFSNSTIDSNARKLCFFSVSISR